MKMYCLALFAISLLLGAHAEAKSVDKVNARARALIARMKSKPQKAPAMAASPLLNFSSSPVDPKQGQNLTWFVQFDNPFSNRDLSIEVKLNGVAFTKVQSPSKGLFVLPLGFQNQAGAQNLEVTLFAENTANNTDVRAAISALDIDINRLTNQINAQRDPVKRAVLQEQRGEKLALKNELATQLKAYRYKLGVQNNAYSVAADASSPALPRITGIDPGLGRASGVDITISGENFAGPVTMLLGGVTVAANVADVHTITAHTPDFTGSLGMKDLELRFATANGQVNTVMPAAFYAYPDNLVSSHKPVAIASGSQRIRLGESAQLDGTLSYDPSLSEIAYEWKLSSVPNGSDHPPGEITSRDPSFTFSTSVPGTYVYELRVKQQGTPDQLVSEPSIAVVQVDGSPQPTAAAIEVQLGRSATTQVFANSPRPGMGVFYSIVQQPSQGAASISNSGLLRYTSTGSEPGQDSLQVKVTDQEGLFGVVQIPVNIMPLGNQPPFFTDNHIFASVLNHGFPMRVVFEPNDDVQDGDGQVVDCIFNIDGREHRANFNQDGCAVAVDLYADGTHLVTITAVDNPGATTSVTQSIGLVNAPLPSGRFTIDPAYGAAPLTVSAVSYEATSPTGYPITPRWRFPDTGGRINGPSSITKVFEDEGTFRIRYVAAADLNPYAQLRRGFDAQVQVGGSAPAQGPQPAAIFNSPQGSEVPVGSPMQFDGSDSFDVALGGSITGFEWDFGGPCSGTCTANTATASPTYTEAGSWYPTLTVTSASGAQSTQVREVFVVNQGHAPRMVLRTSALEGPAPHTVQFDATGSYDYDGAISYYFNSGIGEFNPLPVSSSLEFTYTEPGVYWALYRALDNDGNFNDRVALVQVYPAGYKAAKKAKAPRVPHEGGDDSQHRKEILNAACAKGNGRACYELSEIYSKDGDSFAAQKLKEMACQKGYAPACAAKR